MKAESVQPESGQRFESIDRDVPCVSCGYNLRGLARNHRCPECGVVVSASLRGDSLQFAEPTWVSRMRLGAALACWGIIFALLHMVLWSTGLIGAMSSLYVLGMLAAILSVASLLLLAAPSPRETPETPGRRGRQITRFGYIVFVMLSIPMWVWRSPPPWLITPLGLVMSATYLGWLIITIRYLIRLDALFSTPALRRMPYYCIGAGILHFCFGLAYSGLTLLMSLSGNPGGMNFLLWPVYRLDFIVRLIFHVLLLLCLNRCRKRLGQDAILAKENWSRAPTPVEPIGESRQHSFRTEPLERECPNQ
ncbi:MAG: hypothetical protein JXQ73_05220 [Phycisphaerae bacterium]|nr:hypothetical protein [Phycisphaerae bacterium]